ncbi:MAG: hypothetical protein JWP34_3393 [Massilia sp.]|nr:hypothetical protein [Massilia sp.]
MPIVIEKDDDFSQISTELSDKETYFIGHIVALWGALEHTVFMQTIVTFDTGSDAEVKLPRAMNNMQFTSVLELWKARVVDTTKGDRGSVLQRQYERICKLLPYRNALVHGMWDWSPSDLKKISVVRIVKDQLITTHFDADALADFSSQMGGITFKIRYPGGIDDYVRERADHGFGFSRVGLSVITGNPIADEWIAVSSAPKVKPDVPK